MKVMKIIRKHYKRPDFIPDDSESSELDWIFVGGHGKGAQMHVSDFSVFSRSLTMVLTKFCQKNEGAVVQANCREYL